MLRGGLHIAYLVPGDIGFYLKIGVFMPDTSSSCALSPNPWVILRALLRVGFIIAKALCVLPIHLYVTRTRD